MSYRNKTYIALDYELDNRYYNAMKMWKANPRLTFNFYNAHEGRKIREWSSEAAIRAGLRDRMDDSKLLIVLVGEKTKWSPYVRYEIELAMKAGLPIIAANINGTNGLDATNCPTALRDALCVHVPYGQKTIEYAMEHWPGGHEELTRKGVEGPRHYESLATA